MLCRTARGCLKKMVSKRFVESMYAKRRNEKLHWHHGKGSPKVCGLLQGVVDYVDGLSQARKKVFTELIDSLPEIAKEHEVIDTFKGRNMQLFKALGHQLVYIKESAGIVVVALEKNNRKKPVQVRPCGPIDGHPWIDIMGEEGHLCCINNLEYPHLKEETGVEPKEECVVVIEGYPEVFIKDKVDEEGVRKALLMLQEITGDCYTLDTKNYCDIE